MSKSKASKIRELIFVIAGKEKASVNLECEKLIDRLLESEERALGLFNADAAEVSVTEVLDELRTIPFLARRRVVVVKNSDKFISDNRELLEKYFDNPCPTGILVLTVSGWDSRTRLAKKLPKVGKLLSIMQPKSWELPGRVIKYAADAHDKKLTKTAAELLIELTGENSAQLYGEVDKLAIFAHSEKSITAQHVESLIGHNRIFSVFAVIDSVIAGDVTEAVERLRSMFAASKSAEYSVVGAFAFHFRRMFGAKVLLEKGVRPGEIVERLRIFGDRGRFFAQLRKMSLKQIGVNLQRLGAADYAIKTGRTRAQVAIEQLVLNLAAGSETY